MSEVKATATKRITKKAVVVTEPAKPQKAATAPKAKSTASAKAVVTSAPAKAVGKAPTAGKATTTKTVAGASAPAKPKKATAAPKTVGKAPAAKKLVKKPTAPSHEERQRWVATAAYHRAEKRGFATGYEVQDWLDAEAEINALVGNA